MRRRIRGFSILVLALCLTPALVGAAARTYAQGAGAPKTYPAGPNLVAVPPGTTFSVVETLYTLQPGDTGYEQVAASQGTTAGFGYWAVIAPEATKNGYTSVTLAPGSAAPYRISLPPGVWVMVGDPSGLLPASVQGADAAYAFDPTSGYQTATTLQPGQGAMVISANGGVVTVTPLQPQAATTPSAQPAAAPSAATASGPIPAITVSAPATYSNPVFPNPLTAVSPMSVASWLATPQPPLNPVLPYLPSLPYSGPFLCPSDVVTQVALLLCGALAENGPSASPAVAGPSRSFSTAGVFIVASGCWVGSISSSAGTNSVNGCGNGSFPISLSSVDSINASFQLVTFGTLTVTASCGNPPATQSTQQAFGSFVTVGCHT